MFLLTCHYLYEKRNNRWWCHSFRDGDLWHHFTEKKEVDPEWSRNLENLEQSETLDETIEVDAARIISDCESRMILFTPSRPLKSLSIPQHDLEDSNTCFSRGQSGLCTIDCEVFREGRCEHGSEGCEDPINFEFFHLYFGVEQ